MTNNPARLLVITNDASAVFQRNVIAGARDVASQQGYDVVVKSLFDDPSNSDSIADSLSSADGLLVVANVLSDEELRHIHNSGLPMTLVSHFVPGVPVPSVVSDNTRGIAQLVNHLVHDCGRRQIVFIQGNMEQRDGIKRDLAFRNELIRHDLAIHNEYFLKGDFDPQIATESVRQLLDQERVFDALLASDYLMAVEAVKVLRKAGIRVPEDVCVVGFGDGPEAADAGLTVVAADVIEVGRRGARQLIGQVEGLSIQGLTILSTTLVERDSSVRRINTPIT